MASMTLSLSVSPFSDYCDCGIISCMYIIIGYQLWWTLLSASLPFSCSTSLYYHCLFIFGE